MNLEDILLKHDFEKCLISEGDHYTKDFGSINGLNLLCVVSITDIQKPTVDMRLTDVGGEYHLGKGDLSKYTGAILSEEDFLDKIEQLKLITK